MLLSYYYSIHFNITIKSPVENPDLQLHSAVTITTVQEKILDLISDLKQVSL